MRTHRWKEVFVFSIAMFLLGARSLFAAGTLANTTISNTATVNFKVNGAPQSPVNSLPATFKVDRKINLTTAKVGDTHVVPGSSGQVLKFTVTNNSNDKLDFNFSALDDTNPIDNFDPTTMAVFADNNNNGILDLGDPTFLDEILPDETRTVFVVANIPSNVTNNQTGGITLTAIAAESGGIGTLGSNTTETTGADTPGAVDTVFADAAGDTDGARDGKHSAAALYIVQAAGISVIKTATTISDPFNGTTNPKSIPGAVIEYCIQVTNAAGSQQADEVTISDPIPVNTTFVAGSILAGGTVTAGVCNTTGVSGGTAVSDGVGFSATPPKVTTTVGNVSAGTTVTSRFRVTVN